MPLLPIKGQQIYFLSAVFKSVFLPAQTSTEDVQLSGGYFQVSYIQLNPPIKSSMPSSFPVLLQITGLCSELSEGSPWRCGSRASFSLHHPSPASPAFSSVSSETQHTTKEVETENKALTEIRNSVLRALDSGTFQKAAKCW